MCGDATITRDCETVEVIDLNNATNGNFSSADLGETDEAPKGFFSMITGAVVGGGRSVGIGIGLLILLVVLGYVAVSSKKKSKKAKKK